MSILTLSIDAELENFINSQVKNNEAENKSAVVRSALRMYREELEIQEILAASREIKEGKGLEGDLRELAKQFK